MKLVPLITAGFISAALATSAFAAGGDDGNAPKPTKTTEECEDGKVWDENKEECIEAEQSMFDDDFLYKNAREFAYAGQYDNAIKLLRLAQNPQDPRILNYLGFANRKAGRTELGMKYYRQALAIDPDYNLARSYMGQALVLDGDIDGAWVQLAEIANRGGKDSWPYLALKQSIAGTVTY
ncbi:MAG: tetratricopeptide repeat protein [Rhodobacteraceae bacterium]|nr:tetratricopeptide repeat protein [Paracoccaceae bacterium]